MTKVLSSHGSHMLLQVCLRLQRSVVHAKGFSRDPRHKALVKGVLSSMLTGARNAHKICGVDIPAEFLCPITHEVLAMT